jgi:hypothetical protein
MFGAFNDAAIESRLRLRQDYDDASESTTQIPGGHVATLIHSPAPPAAGNPNAAMQPHCSVTVAFCVTAFSAVGADARLFAAPR